MDILGILNIGEKIIDKVGDYFPTEAEKEKAKQELMNMARAGELKEFEVEVKDRDSARKREMSVGGHMNAVLGGIVVVGFFIVLGFVISGKVPQDVDQMYVGALLGTLGTMTVQVMNYYFGSSMGSKKKDHLPKL